MKLLVFAHVPPPHHGQSYMVKLMLDGFGGDRRKKKNRTRELPPFGIECYHVDARLSKTLEDIGEIQSIKLARIFLFCMEAIWCRFRYGVDAFYYVPAPGKRVALYRDWLVMLICRPFFKRVILHWHAAGLAQWLETALQIRTGAATSRLFKPVDLSIIISRYNLADAEKLLSRRIREVDYGIPDACPDFEKTVQRRRQARVAARKKMSAGQPLGPADLENTGDDPQIIKVLYLANYMREKGLFAALDGVVRANRILHERKSSLKMKLLAAGSFVSTRERLEFDRLMQNPEYAGAVDCLGFVSGSQKENALREADLFCFPTQYTAENQPVSLVEAMAFGLPIVTTRWRSIPEMLPPDYPGLVPDQSPEPIADALLTMMMWEGGEKLREYYLGRFTLERYLRNLAGAIRSVENI
jgi:glycosyltransferase involved in cell wall biosynthesis